MKYAVILAAAIVGMAAGGCPARTTSTEPPATMRAVTGPSTDPNDYTWLCDINSRHCHGCDDPAGCPQEDSGPLCCVGTVCVEWSGSHCSGDLGWCFSYTKTQDPATGVTVAACHDEPSE